MSIQIQENLEIFGFVGLGSMGGPMATNLSKCVDKLRVFDLAGTKERAPENAICCDSLEEISLSCNTLFLSLPDGGDVIQASLELSNMKQCSCKTVIDTSTIGIDAVNPVSGGQLGAKAGTLTFMVSGPENRFRELENILKSMSSNIFYLGEKCGQGQAMKLLNNFLSGTAMLATSEAYAFGINQGLDPEQMFKVLNVSTGVNSATLDKFPKQVASQEYAAGFSNTMMSKDVTLFRESVKKAKTLTTLGEMVQDFWERFSREETDSDFTKIYPFVEKQNSKKI